MQRRAVREEAFELRSREESAVIREKIDRKADGTDGTTVEEARY